MQGRIIKGIEGFIMLTRAPVYMSAKQKAFSETGNGAARGRHGRDRSPGVKKKSWEI